MSPMKLPRPRAWYMYEAYYQYALRRLNPEDGFQRDPQYVLMRCLRDDDGEGEYGGAPYWVDVATITNWRSAHGMAKSLTEKSLERREQKRKERDREVL